MHVNYTNYEQQYQIRGADGTIFWSGTAIIGIPYLVTSAEASTTINSGEGVVFDTTVVIGRDQNPGTSDPDVNVITGKQCTSGAKGWAGIAVQTIKAGGRGLVAGPGSLVAARCTSAAIAVGDAVMASATAGQLAVATTKAATAPAWGLVVGNCIKAAAQIGSTGFYTVGTLVHCSST